MNLPLHYGILGALEAGLIALLLGIAVYQFWHWLARRQMVSAGAALGWACVSAVAIGAGIDAWKLFSLGMMKLESPLYAKLALARIHDPDGLGARVTLELVGALSGVVVGWLARGGRWSWDEHGGTGED